MDGGAPHRFTVTDYHRMAEANVFGIDARVELIRGTVVDKPKASVPHLWTVNTLNMLFASLLVGRAIVSVQNSIRLDDQSEPEPDVVLLASDADRSKHPGPAEVLLVIEVSDTTLDYDRAVKVPLYAESGLVEYWIINIPERLVEVYRNPKEGAYQDVERVVSGRISLEALPGIEVDVAQVFAATSS